MVVLAKCLKSKSRAFRDAVDLLLRKEKKNHKQHLFSHRGLCRHFCNSGENSEGCKDQLLTSMSGWVCTGCPGRLVLPRALMVQADNWGVRVWGSLQVQDFVSEVLQDFWLTSLYWGMLGTSTLSLEKKSFSCTAGSAGCPSGFCSGRCPGQGPIGCFS